MKEYFSSSVRFLRRSPAIVIAISLVFAACIGINAVIFTALDGLVIRPLPFQQPDRLVAIWQSHRNITTIPASGPDFYDWRQSNRSFEGIAAYDNFASYTLTEGTGSEHITAALVTANFFNLLGISPQMGRTFLPEEEQPGQDRVVILSHKFWTEHFGSQPIQNQILNLNGEKFQVLGVMPADFWFPYMEADIWTPLSRKPTSLDSRDMSARKIHWLKIVGRLRPGVSAENARSDLQSIMDAPYWNDDGTRHVYLEPLREQIQEDTRAQVWILMAAALVLLAIGCANIGGLLLAIGVKRRSEFAVRMALGATKLRLYGQLVGETTIILIFAAAIGLWTSWMGQHAFNKLQSHIFGLHNTAFDYRIALFVCSITVIAALGFSLAPVLSLSAHDLNAQLKATRGIYGTKKQGIARKSLVVGQLSMTLVLIATTGLLIKSLYILLHVDPGFSTQNVLTMQIQLPRSEYKTDPQVEAFYARLLSQLRNQPQLSNSAAIDFLPFGGLHSSGAFAIKGVSGDAEAGNSEWRRVSPNYFHAIGIPIFQGRDFSETDSSNAPPVAAISREFAQKWFPNSNPLGAQIKVTDSPEWYQIIAVVGDVKRQQLGERVQPYIYFSSRQRPRNSMFLVVQSPLDAANVNQLVKSELRSLDRSVPVFDVQYVGERIQESLFFPQLRLMLLGIFAIVALILATAGIYGVVSFSVTQRTNEIGVRMALGASAAGVKLLILSEANRLILAGIFLGSVLTLLCTRVLATTLYGIRSYDVVVFTIAITLLAIIGLVAALVPAHRASRLEPVRALRQE